MARLLCMSIFILGIVNILQSRDVTKFWATGFGLLHGSDLNHVGYGSTIANLFNAMVFAKIHMRACVALTPA